MVDEECVNCLYLYYLEYS